MPNSRQLAFFKVVWHEKTLFGIYIIVLHVFSFPLAEKKVYNFKTWLL